MTIQATLQALSLYPLNPSVIENICEDFGLSAADTCTDEVRASVAYKHAQGKVYEYLADAPNVSEAGATYSLTDAQRSAFRAKAAEYLADIDDNLASGITCGWVGEDF